LDCFTDSTFDTYRYDGKHYACDSINVPSNFFQHCVHDRTFDSYVCNPDCKLGEWSDWKRISDTHQERSRQIIAGPSNRGNQCPDLIEKRQIGGRIELICNVLYFNLKFC